MAPRRDEVAMVAGELIVNCKSRGDKVLIYIWGSWNVVPISRDDGIRSILLRCSWFSIEANAEKFVQIGHNNLYFSAIFEFPVRDHKITSLGIKFSIDTCSYIKRHLNDFNCIIIRNAIILVTKCCYDDQISNDYVDGTSSAGDMGNYTKFDGKPKR